MVNSSNTLIVSQDLSFFTNYIKLKIKLVTSFYNKSLPQLKKLDNFISSLGNQVSINEALVAIGILKSLYNIGTNNFKEVCDYNDCFKCSLYNDPNVFKSLTKLVIGEKVQLTTLFYNETLPLLKNLKKLEISNQEHPFPDKFNIPDKLSGVQFNSISVPLSSIWF
ncbi:hypothetical protein ACTFIT_002817 [Dictyostelium discoideum]